jgi:hypothetical protein
MRVGTRVSLLATLALSCGGLLGVTQPVAAASQPATGAEVSMSQDTKAVSQQYPMLPSECAAYRSQVGQSADCTYTVTAEAHAGAPKSVTSLQGLAAASSSCTPSPGYTQCGWVRITSSSPLWSETTSAGYSWSYGKVHWEWVTCTTWGFTWTVKVRWCGAYHNDRPDTNVGANFRVTWMNDALPVYFDRWNRVSLDLYRGTLCCVREG